jgi:ankyrin repeat protein
VDDMQEEQDELLYAAIKTGWPDDIIKAVQKLGNPNYRTLDGETPLSLATDVEYGPLGTLLRVRCVLGLGARVSQEDPKAGSGTSVHQAASNGHVETLCELLAADGKAALAEFDDLGRTPLISAVQAENLRSVTLLLDAGSPVDAHDEETIGDTALIYAVQASNIPIVELLLRYGADPSVQGWMQMSALDHVNDKHAGDEMDRLFARFANGASPK